MCAMAQSGTAGSGSSLQDGASRFRTQEMTKIGSLFRGSSCSRRAGASAAAVIVLGMAHATAGCCAETAMPQATEVGPYRHTCGEPFVAAGELQGRPPLFDDLGALTYPITTTSELARRYFDQGLRLAYAFNHAEARRAFQEAQRLDPACAMCYWGEALVLGPNINMPMDPAAVAPALAALARAKAVAFGATEKERDLVTALGARYSDGFGAERLALDVAYAGAMGRLVEKYPQDLEIAVLYAEALMDITPWDYWEPGGISPKGRTAEILATLERALKGYPGHPGAIHLYIHVVEGSTTPERAEGHADRLPTSMPGAGHIVHMPSHIYYRIGRYKDALEANKAAVAADERYIDRIRAQSLYTAMYYPHNVHFLMAAAQMSGDAPTALAAAEKLSALVTDEAARSIALAQPIKAAAYFAHVLFATPDRTLALARPDGIPYVEAMWHYARGIAFVRKEDLAAARAEAEAIATLARAGDFAAFEAAAIPSVPVLDLAREVLLGKIAQATGDLGAAIAHLERSVALQDGLAYMEPPYWYYPVRQSSGAVLLQAGRLEEAETTFRAAAKQTPSNAWVLFGLAATLRARGEVKAAAEVETHFAKAWAGDRRTIDLGRL
jgi:tetratricopeptide (TPR) repeat protein